MKNFRIQQTRNYYRHYPFAFIEQYRSEIEKNHCGQTLERLNERGGLGIEELYCAITGKDIFKEKIDNRVAKEYVEDLLFEYNKQIIKKHVDKE